MAAEHWELELSVPLQGRTCAEADAVILSAVGPGSEDDVVESGVGFGFRDMMFEFDSEAEALAARDRVLKACPGTTWGLERHRADET